MDRQSNQITAIYTRVDRGGADMQSAISHQKTTLTMYAGERGLTNIRTYSDCGYNGNDTERPALLKLESDIRRGEVSALVLFSLTRLSRNSLVVSEWIENLLPRYHVGLYAIKEGITPERPASFVLPVEALLGGVR